MFKVAEADRKREKNFTILYYFSWNYPEVHLPHVFGHCWVIRGVVDRVITEVGVGSAV